MSDGDTQEAEESPSIGLSPAALLRFVDEGPAGFVATDDRDQIISINATLCRWLDRDRETLVGTSFQMLLPAGDRIYYDTHIRPLLHVQGEIREIAIELVTADRSRVPALLNSLRRIDESGSALTETVIFDARDRRAYERELLRQRERVEKSEARLQMLYDVVSGIAGARTVEEILAVVDSRSDQSADGVARSVWLFDDANVTASRAGRRSPTATTLPSDLDLVDAGGGLGELQEGRSIVVDDIESDEHRRRYPLISEWLVRAGQRSAIVAPLISQSRLLGVLTYGFADAHSFDAFEQRDVESLAIQTAEALQRARLHHSVVIAREQAEVQSRVSAALNRAVTTEQVAEAIAGDGRGAFGAGAIALFTRTGDGPLTLASLSSNFPEATASVDTTVAAAEIPAFRTAMARYAPIFVDDWSRARELLGERVAALPFKAAAVLPLAYASESLGVVLVLFSAPTISLSIRAVLRGLGAEASVALGRAREFETEKRVALTLQQAMLPAKVPFVPGWSIDVFHSAGSEHLVVGGDFYDVTHVPGGRMAIVVGDVVGHGLAAASAMGQLRSAAKTLSLQDQSPAEVLSGLDAFARLTPGAMLASVCCFVFDLTGAGTYASAGHPYPLLISPDGSSTLLTEGRSGVLGLPNASPHAEASTRLTPGESLLLFTDGLIERRGEDLDAGLARLSERVSDIDFTTPDAARRVVEAMTIDVQPDDDIIALVAHLEG